ncbi:MAG: hypothetical protein NTW38_04790 [Candidatus Aminicenantes bacterium]|nr:hypothetical protein [Candidatus Aminicenantes bacterium]
MDSDGRNKQAIFKTAVNLDSSLHGYDLAGSSLSRDGRRILLVSWPGKNQENRIVWSLNSDGSGLKKHPIGVPNAGWISCLGWTPDSRQAVILIYENPRKGETARPTPWIFRLSPDSGVWQALGGNMMGIHLFGMSPAGDRLGYFGLDSSDPKYPRDILRTIDVETTIETDILPISGLQQARWNLEGDQVAFLADNGRRIGIVSVAEKSVLAERSLEVSKMDRNPWTMDWADEGQKIVLSDFKDSRFVLRIFDKAFQNEKVYPLPIDKPLDNYPHVYGLGKKIVVLDFSNSRLWVFDPATEKWKKLF